VTVSSSTCFNEIEVASGGDGERSCCGVEAAVNAHDKTHIDRRVL